MADLIRDRNANVRFVIDLHGAALYSATLDPDQTIDLGFRSEREDERSMDERHIAGLGLCCKQGPAVVRRNRFAAKRSRTVTSFVHKGFGRGTRYQVQSIQIEPSPRFGLPVVFPRRLCMSAMVCMRLIPIVWPLCSRLADFIEYLKATV